MNKQWFMLLTVDTWYDVPLCVTRTVNHNDDIHHGCSCISAVSIAGRCICLQVRSFAQLLLVSANLE